MSQKRWTWTTEQVLPSELGAGAEFIDQVLVQLSRHQWGEHDLFSVRLALEEALVNAMKHGNCLDRDKRVAVVCKMSPSRLLVTITDEGPGFAPDAVPDPTAPENLERASGRGLMLMRSFMSRVEFNDTGNTVHMEKERGGGR